VLKASNVPTSQEGMSGEPLMMSAAMQAPCYDFGHEGLTKVHVQNYIYFALVLVN